MNKGWLKRVWTGVLIAAILLSANVTQAAQISGVTFAETVPAGPTQLQLRGTAVLTWGIFFDVYAGALYLPAAATGAAWHEDLPKRLELEYFRAIRGEDFAESSDQLLRRNLPPATYQTLRERLQLLYRLFRDVQPGDRYSLSYHPATGTELRLNGALLGAIPGADFASAYFGLWLGDKPISTAFRDRLLSTTTR